ncbi:DNA cytosine methyltransferase [Seleniivibrio woodruffii]|uniref:DNA cytosine methyltransferase n=1 Tax=Seleniivibrio woodruffii TaxID=1078050 RepID=UPI00240A6B8A|nr:DNA (cytosine-5-)-methyltransferase [Seleniivibrio woodruffii]
MSKLKAVSLFSGCGGFDYGVCQNGIDVIWANDIDPHAMSGYKSIHPNTEFYLRDIRQIENFPSADVLIGCYPCTGFSQAARRRWKDLAPRDLMNVSGNFLYLEYLRALKQIKPLFFMVENVKGMVSAKNGWFFQEQLNGFKEAGYKTYFKLLRAHDFGVPQARERVFIVGFRQDLLIDCFSFPEATHGSNGLPYTTIKDALNGMNLWPEGEFYNEPYHGHFLTRNRKKTWDDVSYTIVANASHVPLHPIGQSMIKIETDKWELQGDTNRRFSWKECVRLQGLPDHINPNCSLTNKYKVVGNAVPPKFGDILSKQVIKTLQI